MSYRGEDELTDSYEDLDRRTDELLNSSLKALQEQNTSNPEPSTSSCPSIEDQLALAKASRNQAESARQKIANEILTATKEVCQKLISEGELTLEKAKKLEAKAEQKHREAQCDLQQAETTRSEAVTSAEKVASEAQQLAQYAAEQAKSVQVDADAQAEKVKSDAQRVAQAAAEQAQSVRDDADAYTEKVMSDAQRVATELVESTRSVAEQEAEELKKQAAVESQRTLAKAELIRIAAQEELEAQRIYAETARVTAESLEVLAQIRAKLAESPDSPDTNPDEVVPLGKLDPNWQSVRDTEGHSPLRDKPTLGQPTVDVYSSQEG